MKLEIWTIRAMIQIYCRNHHGIRRGLCSDCAELLAYAEERIKKCPFGVDKPVCNRCRVHCYKPALREKVQRIMRFSGPRMSSRHPILALRHVVRSRFYGIGRSK